jgi:release factor glutamine methyltransferase
MSMTIHGDDYAALLGTLSRDLKVLADKSEENADNTLRALWLKAAGIAVSSAAAEQAELPRLNAGQLTVLKSLVASRLAGVPLAHLTERQDFMAMEFIVNKGLYIPRKETELLAKTAIDTIKCRKAPAEHITVLDICAGIGTVALAIAKQCDSADVYGSDIYAPAVAAAVVNAAHFGLTGRSRFFHADLFEPFESLPLKGAVDVIVSAPPYISSAKVKTMAEEIAQHEPEAAFNAGPFGLDIFHQLIAIAPVYLRRGGHLIVECGLGQGTFLAKRLRANPRYSAVTEVCDAQGNLRVLSAEIGG